ncbi:MAG: cytidine deaminase [Flavobacteriales bacterium]|jgi:cytidine deaminase
MKPISIHFEYQRYDSYTELQELAQRLLLAAKDAMHRAYAPYSQFHVGAAILLENNSIVEGNNQENAAYPSGLCAERVAIFSVGANFPNQTIQAIAITASSANYIAGEPVTPCGACRQSMLEYELKQGKPIAVYLLSPSNEVIVIPSVSQLLPLHFDASNLRKG